MTLREGQTVSVWLCYFTDEQEREVRGLLLRDIGTRIGYEWRRFSGILRLWNLSAEEFDALTQLYPKNWRRGC